MILVALISTLFLQVAADPVDDLAARLVARLVSTPASNIVRVSPGEDVRALLNGRGLPLATRVGIYSFNEDSSGSGYRRINEVRLRDLPPYLENADFKKDIYVSLAVDPPRFGLSISDGGSVSTDALRLLSSAMVARISGDAPLKVDDGFQVFGSAFPIIGEELESIRTRVINANLKGLVHVALYRGPTTLRLACQIVGGSADDDDLFSIETNLTPEISALLQVTPSSGGGGQALMARLPLMDNTLAVCALNADDDDDADIAVLTPGEILFFHHGDAGLQPFRAISLGNLLTAVYPTRAPSGSITPADINGDGRTELLVGSNMFTLGAVVFPHNGFRVENLSGIPVASISINGSEAIVTSDYLTGTDYFGKSAFFGDGKDNNRPLQPELAGMIRRLINVPGHDSTLLALTHDWRLLLQQIGERARVISAGNNKIRAITSGIGRVAVGYARNEGECRIEIGMPVNGRFEAEISTTTTLDIRDLAIYNSAIHSATYIAVLGVEDGVGMVLEVRRLPTAVGE